MFRLHPAASRRAGEPSRSAPIRRVEETRAVTRIGLVCFLILRFLVPDLARGACIAPRRYLTTELQANNWEVEAAQFDDLALQLSGHPEWRADIIIYGPRRGHRNEVPARMNSFEDYLLN